MELRRQVLVALGFLTSACTHQPSTPTESSLAISAISPPSGSAVVVPEDYVFFVPGGVVIPPSSGLVSVRVSLTSAREIPFAQLNVYLLTGGPGSEYCGQNSPDSPSWRSLPSAWTTTFSVTGFRVYRLPCAVTGIRAMWHTRNSGALTPPMAAETIAEATVPVSFQIRR